jgi:hypothetical protein
MDTGSRSFEVARAVPWLRATLVWMLIILAETAHGAAREIFIAPALGDLRARQLGIPIACVIVFAIAWATSRWLGAATRGVQLAIGLWWATLTLAFEFTLGRAIGLSWSRILCDYDPSRGGFMIFGIAFMVFAPMLAAKLRRP